MGIRINKYIADSGYCSRRAAETLIEQRRVRVNNQLAIQGMQIEENDVVYVDNKALSNTQESICLLMHKPIQVVSTAKDPEGRTTVLDLLPEKYQNYRLYPVGRLDFFSEGLIILTNDGELAHKLMHPKHDLPRLYRVRVRKNSSHSIESILSIMQEGMVLEDGTQLAPVKTRIFNERNTTPVEYDVEFTLYQGVNRQIRRMCQESDLTILRLMRIGHGPLSLSDIPRGGFRELTKTELETLKRSI